jgi:hypothetical protein
MRKACGVAFAWLMVRMTAWTTAQMTVQAGTPGLRVPYDFFPLFEAPTFGTLEGFVRSK